MAKMSKNQIDDIKNSISRYLSMREHSRLEIFEKLIRKDFDQTLIDQCLLEFSTNNLLSDQRYTETFIRSKYNNGKGPSFIKASLKLKGIDSQTIQTALSKISDDDWVQSATKALKKKTIKKNMSEQEQKQKQQQFLSQRGFTINIMINAINEYWK